VDGVVEEWPWKDSARVITLSQTPSGAFVGGLLPSALAASDKTNLYLAIRIPMPKGAKPRGGGAYRGDGVEISFQNTDPKAASSPIFILWGGVDGHFEPVSAGGISGEQMDRASKAIVYAASIGKEEWMCEWGIPFAAVDINPSTTKFLRFNIGCLDSSTGNWIAWYATGGALFEVGGAGELILGGG